MQASTKEKHAHLKDENIHPELGNHRDILKANNLYSRFVSNNSKNDGQKYVPLLQRVQLDLAFANIGSYMMLGKLLLSAFISDKDAKDQTKMTFPKFLDESFKKIRQVAQYSIHAQPGLSQREPDDITSDMVHNLEAASLGRSVYTLNAFFAPWLTVAKLFFPFNDKLIGFGFISRMIDFTDNTIGKVTNMFWNLRRITKGLIPYDGGITTEQLTSKQAEVRELMNYAWQKYLVGPIAAFKQIFVKNPRYVFEENTRRILLNQLEDTNKLLQNNSLVGYLNNIKAFFTGKYICPHEDSRIEKKIGSDEPDNLRWYVRSKILSQVLSLPAGFFGTLLNSSSIAVNFFGNFFGSHALRSFSDKLTDIANGLMSLVYITGEVPANINEFFKKLRHQKEAKTDYRNLGVAACGVLGMVNRMKVLPGISAIFNTIGVKPLLDKYHRFLENFFLLFFSYNRLVIHDDERKEVGSKSSARDIDLTAKHEKIWKHFTLPFRVLFRDEDVTYNFDQQGNNERRVELDDKRDKKNISSETLV